MGAGLKDGACEGLEEGGAVGENVGAALNDGANDGPELVEGAGDSTRWRCASEIPQQPVSRKASMPIAVIVT